MSYVRSARSRLLGSQARLLWPLDGAATAGAEWLMTKANNAIHRMSGKHVTLKFVRGCLPLIGDLCRWVKASVTALR